MPPFTHSSSQCTGECEIHPLLVGENLTFHLYIQGGGTWGSYMEEQERKALAAETEEQKSLRLKKERELTEQQDLSAASLIMKTHAEVMGLKRAKKNNRPCKWLFFDENNKIKTNKIVSECWAYEYMDPKTKQKKKPHTCPFLHPGENGWRSEWC